MSNQDQAQEQLLLMSTIIGPAAGLIGCSILLLAFSIPIFCRQDAVYRTLPRNTLTTYTISRLVGYLLLGLSLITQSDAFSKFSAAVILVGSPVLFYGALSSVRRWWTNLRARRVPPNVKFATTIVDTALPFVFMAIEFFYYIGYISGVGEDMHMALPISVFGYLALGAVYITAAVYIIIAYSGRWYSRKDCALILALGLLLFPARAGSFLIHPAYSAPSAMDGSFQSYWLTYILLMAVPDVLIAAILSIFASSFSRITRLDHSSDTQHLIYKPQPWTMPAVSQVEGPAQPPYEAAESYA